MEIGRSVNRIRNIFGLFGRRVLRLDPVHDQELDSAVGTLPLFSLISKAKFTLWLTLARRRSVLHPPRICQSTAFPRERSIPLILELVRSPSGASGMPA
jgi:hypothetical protein